MFSGSSKYKHFSFYSNFILQNWISIVWRFCGIRKKYCNQLPQLSVRNSLHKQQGKFSGFLYLLWYAWSPSARVNLMTSLKIPILQVHWPDSSNNFSELRCYHTTQRTHSPKGLKYPSIVSRFQALSISKSLSSRLSASKLHLKTWVQVFFNKLIRSLKFLKTNKRERKIL